MEKKNKPQKSDLLSIYDYLAKSGFSEQQAKGLARVIDKVKDNNVEPTEVKPAQTPPNTPNFSKLFVKVRVGALVAIAFVIGNSLPPLF